MSAASAHRRCILCSINLADTQEHVPPESFFEQPYPPNLITVPACTECNHGSHLDDEYLLAYLVSLDMPGASPTLDLVRQRITRGLHRPQFPGLRRRLQRAIEFSCDRDPATGTRLAYHVTGNPVRRSTFMQIERIHNRQTRPPDFWEQWVKASEYALKGETGSVGDVFRWHHRDIRRSACAAVVRLEYYGVFAYVALIYRPDFSPPQRVAYPF
jgi:hypothetical protein